jgi:carbon-monoxide dehydrogenase medium subunit
VRNFDYVSVQSIDEAVARLQAAGPEARLLAGGTDVIVQMRERRREVPVLIDVKSIPETNVLSYDPATGLRVGAAVPCYRVTEHPEVARLYPALVDSASLIGGTAIQGRASLGGNLCNASPAADGIPTLYVLSAVCNISGPQGVRAVHVEAFCTAPGRTVLQAGELLVSLDIPAPEPRSGAAFLRFIPRNEMDIAVVNAAAHVQLDGQGTTITSARIAIGAVAPTVLLVPEAANALVGAPANEESIAKAAALAQAAAKPIADMRGSINQRRHLVGVLTRRVLHTAVERARTN